jgi:isoaspartyl peptidase/L-asparaginase-like protein (Ntn-hydrolase superfamily)
MERTSHVMLAGGDADEFADLHGLAGAELLSPEAHRAWEAWRDQPAADRAAVDQSRDRLAPALRPIDGRAGGDGRLFGGSLPSASPDPESRWKHHDTIGTLAIDAAGTMAGACSTSGTPYKVPGRIGDSPIIGHGLYVDPAVGGATATGVGELVMGICGSFLAVELMRQGRSPLEAATAVVERIRDSFTLLPHHQLAVIAVARDGRHAGAALRPGFRLAIHDSLGSRVAEPGRTLLPD